MKKTIAILLLLLFACLPLCGALAQEEKQDVSHYLLLGFDFWGSQEIGTSFNDTNILFTLDRTNGRILIATIMRDSYVTLPDGRQSKLNQVVRKSDFETMVQTVESTLDIEIEAYFAIGAPGFARLIGELSGVEVDISESEYASLQARGMTANIPGPGKQVLRGNGLYAYLKDRYMGGGDRARTGKAQGVLEQLVKQAREMPLTQLISFATSALEEIETNASLPELLELASSAYAMRDAKVETFTLPAENTYQYGTAHGSSIVDADWEANRALYAAFVRAEE